MDRSQVHTQSCVSGHSTFITQFPPTYKYNPPPPQLPLVAGTFPLPEVYEPPLHAFIRVLLLIEDPEIYRIQQ